MRLDRLAVLVLPVALGLISCGDSATGPAATVNPFFEDRVLNIAHRGANFLAPEETLEAYHAAKESGADILEMDLQRTADGEIVVLHDSTVDRTTDGTGRVRDMTLAQIKSLDAGYRFTRDGGETHPFRGQGLAIPTLREIFETFPEDFMIIEIKGSDPTVGDDYARLLREYDMVDQVITASFSEVVIDAFRATLPEAWTSLAQDEVIVFFALSPEAEAEYEPPGEFLHVPPRFQGIEVLTPDFVARADRFGLPIHVFGPGNDADSMQSLIDIGVRGLMVDDVALASEVIARNE